MNVVNFFYIKIKRLFTRIFKFPKIYKVGQQYHVASVEQTIDDLQKSNKSLGRFGDGELGWVCNKDILPKYMSFEHSSFRLQKKLIEVLNSSNSNFDIGISPLSEAYDKHYKLRCRRGLKAFMCELGPTWMKYLDKDVQYYNTNITRPYSSFKHYSYSKYIFQQIKSIWRNKKILIVEGRGTRLGVNDDLFDCASSIKRIECPSINAFEVYADILNVVSSYLRRHYIDLVLLALGPTATVLAYDLCNKGFRAIDIGHVDIEYEWFLRKKICNIPYKCVNEISNGQKVIPIHDTKYEDEIIGYV